MAHQCTACGRTFEDGSTAMLSGCPDCGGNTFQYFKGDPPETPGTPPEPEIDTGVGGTVGQKVGKARAAVTGLMGDGYESPNEESATSDDDDILVADETPLPPDGSDDTPAETTAEATTPGSTDEVDSEPETTAAPAAQASSNAPAPDETADEPSLEELRAELNDQFESIKILEPGQYELNLMELYEREEHIIALQEDGRYVIDVPGTGEFAGE
jgi:predicted  nucleic acid-binding Zn-ribbon protein